LTKTRHYSGEHGHYETSTTACTFQCLEDAMLRWRGRYKLGSNALAENRLGTMMADGQGQREVRLQQQTFEFN